jgi:hypothetical protein
VLQFLCWYFEKKAKRTATEDKNKLQNVRRVKFLDNLSRGYLSVLCGERRYGQMDRHGETKKSVSAIAFQTHLNTSKHLQGISFNICASTVFLEKTLRELEG